MRKITVSLAVIAASLWATFATTASSRAMCLRFTDGTQQLFTIGDDLKWSYSKGVLTVSPASSDNLPLQSFDIENVDNISYAETSAVSDTHIAPALFSLTGSTLTVSGLRARTRCTVTDISGVVVAAASGQECTIDLSYSPAGIYILSLSDGRSFKFTIK